MMSNLAFSTYKRQSTCNKYPLIVRLKCCSYNSETYNNHNSLQEAAVYDYCAKGKGGWLVKPQCTVAKAHYSRYIRYYTSTKR